MKEQTAKLFDRAQDAIEAAEILLTNEKVDKATGPAYYDMFFTAQSFVERIGLAIQQTQRSPCRVWEALCQNKFARPEIPSLADGFIRQAFDQRLWS